jgi:3-oxoacyl-[acyl-carrier protein] reductase
MECNGKTAVVTGGSRGIGAAICKRLATDGFSVHLVYRDADEAAEQVASGIRAKGGRVTVHKADVSDEAQVQRLTDKVVEQDDGIHVLVNNAGVIDDQLVIATKLQRWERVLKVNLTGPFLMCRAVIPTMMDQRWGRIINLSSNSVRIPGSGQAAYAASKGGLEALTRGLAMEVGHKGIRINSVAPGRVRTDMTHAVAAQLGEGGPRWGEPKDLAGIVSFLAGEDSDYIQGQLITVDGGRLVMRPRGEARH